MADISGFGSQATLRASNTFPAPITITQWADDADPIDIPSIAVADKAMGVNGDLLTWSKATPTDITLRVIPNGSDDKNLQILLNRNRVGKGKTPAQDTITLNVLYPDGQFIQALEGKLTNGPSANSVASAGRLKTKEYTFTFENIITNL